MNIPKLIHATEQAKMWRELHFLYVHYEEFFFALFALN